MASSNKSTCTSAALFLSLNLLFFSFVRSADVGATCPIDTSTLSGCAGLLGLVKDAAAGSTDTCCGLLTDLTDLEVAVCLCATIKALGIIAVDVDLDLTVLLNACGRTRPAGYVCT